MKQICFAKPGLTEDLYRAIHAICAIRTLDGRPSISYETNESSRQRILHKNSYSKGKNVSDRGPRGAWRREEMIGDKPTVVK
jgi:hypothetical protein